MGGQGNVLSITILKKEQLIVHTDSREAKEEWLERFADCQKFAATLGLKVKTDGAQDALPLASSSLLSSASHGSAAPNLMTPALSPAISVTPSSTHGHTTSQQTQCRRHAVRSPRITLMGSDLSRQASFNSIASFPKVGALTSPDLGSGSAFSPRSPSPSQFGPGGGPNGFNGARPPMPRPGMMSPGNGTLSPDTSPAFGPPATVPAALDPMDRRRVWDDRR